MAHELNDKTRPVAGSDSHDVGSQASRNLLAEVHSLHVASVNRNNADNADSVKLGINSDKKGIALADQTMAQGEKLQQYLAKGGDFSDAEGKKLGAQFVSQLRRESADHRTDRAGAQEFVGRAMPENVRQQAFRNSNSIADGVATLDDPKTSAHDRADALTKIMKSAESINSGLHDSTGKAGKDQKAAEAESKVIIGDVKALQGAHLTAEQKSLLIDDIYSKSCLIRGELRDAPNEQREIQHDTAAIQSGANLETTLRYAMANPGHASKALEQVKSGLNGLNNGEGTGLLEAVKIDRQEDMIVEPTYMANNSRDNAQNNSKIIEFTSPYAAAARH